MTKLAESKFQTKLIKDLRGQGWKIYKTQSGFGYILPDLFVSKSGRGGAWLELKTLGTVNQKIPITKLQRKELTELRNCGTVAWCLICVRDGNDDLLFLTHPEETYVDEQRPIYKRKFRQKFCGKSIASAIWGSDKLGTD